MDEQKQDKPVVRDALTLSLSDSEFIEIAKDLVEKSETFYKKKGSKLELSIEERIKENKKYLFGRQINDIRFKKYDSKMLDNIIYESERTLKPMAISRLPDIIVSPGSNTPERQKVADALSKVVDGDIKHRKRRQLLGLAFKHQPVYFIACIKVFWNPEKGKYGDFDFKEINPDRLTLDHTALGANAKNMGFVREKVPYTVQELVMRFPDKEKEIYTEVKAQLGAGSKFDVNNPSKTALNTKIDINEIWFLYYDKVEGQDNKYERKVCVGWYYGKLLLDKMLHPYWDWTGKQRPVNFKEIDQEKLQQDIIAKLSNQSGMDIQMETTFKNHLEAPEFPYIFLGYDQWGEMPLDETSRIEQVRLLQDGYDRRSRQITGIIDRSAGKNVYSTIGGMKKDDIEKQDFNNYDQDMVVTGNVGEVFAHIAGPQANGAMLQDKQDIRNRIFDKMGVHGPVRGEVDPNTPATNNQISREGDFTVMDDISDEMITSTCESMANWELHMIKLFYTPEQAEELLGKEGKTMLAAVQNDLIDDGCEVEITASGTDKLRRKQQAIDNAKMGMTDPLQYYKDMEMSDPEGRTEKLFMWMRQPDVYYQKFVQKQDTLGMIGQLNGQGSMLASQAIMAIQAGQVPQVPPTVDEAYLKTFQAFMDDPNGMQAVIQKFPQIKDQLIQFSQAILQRAQGSGQPSQPAVPATTPSQPTNSGTVGPTTTGNPSPTNTAVVPVAPAA